MRHRNSRIPLVAILAGILFGRHDAREIRTEMNARFDKVDQRFERVHDDLRQFYHLTGKLEGRLEAIEKRN